MERTKNWTQFYQVWAWDADVTRLMQFKVKKGSMIWLAGSQRLVDVRMKDGKLEKKLKVSLNAVSYTHLYPLNHQTYNRRLPMRKFTTRIYTKANYLLNRGRMALSNRCV